MTVVGINVATGDPHRGLATGQVTGAPIDPAGPPMVRLSLLGGFSLTIGSAALSVPESTQRLLAYLGLDRGPHDRCSIAARLWPDKLETRAAANLRSSLWRLPRHRGRRLIEQAGSSLQLAPDVVVDVGEFEASGWALMSGEDHLVDSSRTLLHRSLLPGWYDEWVLEARNRLSQLQFHFLEALTYALLRRGAVAEALDSSLRLVAADPLREGSQRALLTVYCLEGSFGQAQRQLDRYTFLMEDEFGRPPALSIGRILREIDEGQALNRYRTPTHGPLTTS